MLKSYCSVAHKRKKNESGSCMIVTFVGRWGRGGVGLGAVEEVGAEALGGKVAPRVEDAPRSTRCCPAASSETKTTASPASSGSSAMTACSANMIQQSYLLSVS
uniref:Uncharacterized protein n=1 Tax=Oryza barthii TaxID=65489 RepID=A0A0D3HPR9_9ORYZ